MLGAVLDSRLSFDHHVAVRVAKATGSLNVVRILLGAKKGLRPELARLMVMQTAGVQLMWMGAVWWKGEKAGKKMRMLESVQKEMARVICGGFRSASREAMEVEAGLQPVHLELALAHVRLALRAAVAAPSHPLHSPARLALAALAKGPPKHPSPLHLAFSSSLVPRNAVLETVHAEPVALWEPAPRVTIAVEESKERAKEVHDAVLLKVREQDMVIFTDGSLMEQHSGSGVAVRVKRDGELLWATRSRSLGLFQGVYQAELEGLRLALSFLPSLIPHFALSHVHIFADNSSAISLPFDPRPSSAQYLRFDIRQRLLELQHSHPQLSITLHWIAGHEGVEGNELADEMARRGSGDGIEAKAAAERKQGRRRGLVMPREAIEVSLSSLDDEGSLYWEEETSGVAAGRVRRGPLRPLTTGETDNEGRISGGNTMPKSAASVLPAAKAALKLQWEREWSTAPVGAALRDVDSAPPSSAFRRRLRSLPRPLASLLTRLQTDFSNLAHPLHRARLHPTGLCECGDQDTR
ncbi:hypothetical protein JCM11641_003824, partial [Rhodosporidiobolus odoratus]